VLYCFIYTAPVLSRFSHDLCALIPDTLTVATAIEEMFLGFFLLTAEHTKGGTNEAALSEIVPSECPFVHH